jgi:hypothetical protein
MMTNVSKKMITPINANTREPIKAPDFNHSNAMAFSFKNVV